MDISAVRQAAAGRWRSILESLAPSLDAALARPGRHTACPVHGGKDGFRVFSDFEESGGGICNTCGPQSDGFALLMWINDWDFVTALHAVSDLVNTGDFGTAVVPAVRPRKPAVDPREADRLRRRLARIWKQTMPLDTDTALPVMRYLKRRGLHMSGELPHDLRAHPGLDYYDGDQCIGKFPAMVAVVRDPSGRAVTLHATYLTPEGEKAPVESVKKLMAYPKNRTLKGAAIRLAIIGDVLGVAEGVETALAVMEATRMPVWSGVNAAMLAQIIPPEGVKRVYVWGDLDRKKAGQKAAGKAIRKMHERNLAVAGIFPPATLLPAYGKGLDWLDVYLAHPEAIRVPPKTRRVMLERSKNQRTG